MTGASMATRPWRERKNEVQERKESTRDRIRNASAFNGEIPALFVIS